MQSGEVIIHRIDLSAADPNHLSEPERGRAARFHHEADRRRWTAARVALRRILGDTLGIPPAEVPIILTRSGKPVLDAPHDAVHFNLSHAGDLMLVAVATCGPVGIDVEPVSRAADLAGCEETFCHPDEIADLPADSCARHARLLEIWTAKEALLKAAGSGFLHPPESVRIEPHEGGFTWRSDPPIPEIDGWRLLSPADSLLDGCRTVVCVPPHATVRIIGRV